MALGPPAPLLVSHPKDVERLQANGVQFMQPAPEDYPFGVRIEALDPDGN